ncbi:MAG: hypothetical protein WHX93_17800 [bacterium]
MDEEIRKAQRLRLGRFGMAAVTYLLAGFACFLTQQLGLGQMSAFQWVVFVAIAIAWNLLFFIIFLNDWNLRFKDPSLTKEQIVLSALWGFWALYHLPEARPIVLTFYVPAFSFGMLRLNRPEYLKVTATVMALYGCLLLLEYFQGRPGFRPSYEIFLFCLFGILFCWLAFFGGFVSDLRRRLRLQNLEVLKANEGLRKEMEQRQRIQEEKDRLLQELKETLGAVKTLKGLIPICAWCKKIRNDTGYWQELEAYIKDHSDAELSHGICPECARDLTAGLKMRDKASF